MTRRKPRRPMSSRAFNRWIFFGGLALVFCIAVASPYIAPLFGRVGIPL